MPGFHPYVPGALPTYWYRLFESRGTTNHMWSMWFIYYMHINMLYSVYSNLGVYTGEREWSFVVNRFERGMHVGIRKTKRCAGDVDRLINVWKDEYVVFPAEPARLNWNGSFVPNDRRY